MGVVFFACNQGSKETQRSTDSTAVDSLTIGQISLPEPDTNASETNFSDIIGWPEGKTPVSPPGFVVSRFADGFQSPRWIYEAPNGDIFVAESATESSLVKKAGAILSGKAKSNQQKPSANRIAILRDADKDGKPELKQIFLTGLKQPLGMLIIGNYFYVANTNGIVRYPYKSGDTRLNDASGKMILNLPAGGYNNHWTRNIIANADGSKIYISVGSGSNVAEQGMENEVRRANILEINPDGTSERVYASGLRNPVGMDWAPGTSALWTSVNERDGLGDDLVPDYLTGVKDGAFYGWPYSYFGQIEDPRLKGKAPEMVSKAVIPDVPLGSHTASLGLAFYDQKAFSEKYHQGAFVGQHGSWNRSELVGYKVVFIPFKNGRPSGLPEDFLTGFVAGGDKSEVYGRPVGLAVLKDGSLLVADDASNVIWRVAKSK
ncbi:MAG: sorbosone dehydrogenase family protein [Daejeonella sp.]